MYLPHVTRMWRVLQLIVEDPFFVSFAADCLSHRQVKGARMTLMYFAVRHLYADLSATLVQCVV